MKKTNKTKEKTTLKITIIGNKFRIELSELLTPEDIHCHIFKQDETDNIRKLQHAIIINQTTVDDDKPELVINSKEQCIIGYNSRILLMLCLLQRTFENELTFENEEEFRFKVEIKK